jgi:predicted metalloendopeptidase
VAFSTPPKSGIDLDNFDKSVRPQDDFFEFVNGQWLKTTEIPADKATYGASHKLIEESEKNLRVIIEEAAAMPNKKSGSNEQKVGDFYQSYMDSALVEKLGLKPLEEDLARIQKVGSKDDLIKLMAYFQKVGVQRPFFYFINQDNKNSTEYIGYLNQGGLGMPDRDYYFNEADKFKDIREKYLAYVEKLLTLGGQKDAAAKAKRIMEIETGIAQSQWTRVENRDRDKTYNKYDFAKLQNATPNFNWKLYFGEAGLAKTKDVIVRQPSYFEAFGKQFDSVSIEDWKTYYTYKLLNGAADLLPAEFVNAKFEFYGKTLRGTEALEPRWKRAVAGVEGTLGEVVGKIYVERHFKPEAKARMEQLVANLKISMKERIQGLEWMQEETKKQALAKLEKFHTKIGYPNKWKDYSKLAIEKDELLLNTKRSNIVEYERMIAKLGQPIDREEWLLAPQEVNAYYNSTMNEIVFPAAILQPPFFDMNADDAVNYGGIGGVIGHEITHGFDDQGRKSDGDGNLRDWWTEKDGQEFVARSQVMVEQYNHFNPIDTMHVNGKLTLGENIGDLGGLTVAYYAYQKSLGGKAAPVIDGYTGEQRFFIGWAQVWCNKYRDDELRNRIVTDVHSPSRYRTNGVLANMPQFYAAFEVKEGDGMYRPGEKLVKIW